MREGWKNTTWGEIATLEYGKSLRDYQSKPGDVPVYGDALLPKLMNGEVGVALEEIV